MCIEVVLTLITSYLNYSIPLEKIITSECFRDHIHFEFDKCGPIRVTRGIGYQNAFSKHTTQTHSKSV